MGNDGVSEEGRKNRREDERPNMYVLCHTSGVSGLGSTQGVRTASSTREEVATGTLGERRQVTEKFGVGEVTLYSKSTEPSPEAIHWPWLTSSCWLPLRVMWTACGGPISK